MRTSGESVGDGTAQDSWRDIGIFGGAEFQPGTHGVRFQRALSFQTAADTLANQLNQLLHFAFVWRLEVLKSGCALCQADSVYLVFLSHFADNSRAM